MCKKHFAKRALERFGRYLINILISVDQLGNSILAGDPDETISSRLGKDYLRFGETFPKRRPISKFTFWWLDKIDPGHCVDAIEPDRGLRHWQPSKKIPDVLSPSAEEFESSQGK